MIGSTWSGNGSCSLAPPITWLLPHATFCFLSCLVGPLTFPVRSLVTLYLHIHATTRFLRFFLNTLTLEDEATMLSQNTGNQIPSYASSYSSGERGEKTKQNKTKQYVINLTAVWVPFLMKDLHRQSGLSPVKTVQIHVTSLQVLLQKSFEGPSETKIRTDFWYLLP